MDSMKTFIAKRLKEKETGEVIENYKPIVGNETVNMLQFMAEKIQDKDLKKYGLKKKRTRTMQLRFKDYEELFKKDIREGNGFIIKEKPKEGMERTDDSIYSRKFGSIWEDENAFEELYSCECKKLQGKVYDRLKCDKCGTIVKFVDKNIDMTGWFELKNYSIIHPVLYQFIASVIGVKNLDEIIKIEDTEESGLTKDGLYQQKVVDENSKKPDKFHGIGMIEFEKRFDEIIQFYFKKKKNKKEHMKIIMDNRDKIFTKYFPAFTLFLRPIFNTDENFGFTGWNKQFIMMTTKVLSINRIGLLNERNGKKLLDRLYKTQKLVLLIDNLIDSALSKKKGHIRQNMTGARLNFSARNVIVPLSGNYRTNEIHLPYIGFLELYKPEIISLLKEVMTFADAVTTWYNATIKFDPKVYKIMEHLVDHTVGGLWTIIDRNPSINYGSALCMRVAKVKADISDLTMAVPINILAIIAGDYDGDVLNILALKGQDLTNKFRSLYDPELNMVVSRNDGKFSSNFLLIKEQQISLYSFCRLGKDEKTFNATKITKEEENIKSFDAKRIHKVKKRDFDKVSMKTAVKEIEEELKVFSAERI